MTVYVCHYSISPTHQINQAICSVFKKNKILAAIVGTLDSPFKGTSQLKQRIKIFSSCCYMIVW